MSEFEEKLNAILSSPEAMAQVASLAQSLGGGQEAKPAQEASPPAVPVANQQPAANQQDGLGSLLGSLDPSMLQKLLPLVGELNSPRNSEREQLLHALAPFLKESRRSRVDQALKAARMIRLGKEFLGRLGD